RLPGTQGYELIFYPPMQNFPSKDLLADTTATNQQLEKMIMECDDQYMWMHRRFKTRPEGESSFYE
ncbi:MAG TPA: lipid A biosynthesis lauroyl acyltransferase, partial [Psychromonas hadalis]|nr:lipid A biosynthesis lauroyl acyltransferase [Psychromonas hadalis]